METVQRYRLSDRVPEDVRHLWAVAQGVMIYGYFFSPLWVIGDEQLHRVTDAAVAHAYRRFADLPENQEPPPLKSRIEWLLARRYIDPHWTPRWMAIADLRNYGSHPLRQRTGPPHDALRSLSILRDEIKLLFASDEPQFVGTPKWRPRPGQLVQAPKRVSVGDRYALGGHLQSALDHLHEMQAAEDGDFTAARLLIERTRDQLLGIAE